MKRDTHTEIWIKLSTSAWSNDRYRSNIVYTCRGYTKELKLHMCPAPLPAPQLSQRRLNGVSCFKKQPSLGRFTVNPIFSILLLIWLNDFCRLFIT